MSSYRVSVQSLHGNKKTTVSPSTLWNNQSFRTDKFDNTINSRSTNSRSLPSDGSFGSKVPITDENTKKVLSYTSKRTENIAQRNEVSMNSKESRLASHMRAFLQNKAMMNKIVDDYPITYAKVSKLIKYLPSHIINMIFCEDRSAYYMNMELHKEGINAIGVDPTRDSLNPFEVYETQSKFFQTSWNYSKTAIPRRLDYDSLREQISQLESMNRSTGGTVDSKEGKLKSQDKLMSPKPNISSCPSWEPRMSLSQSMRKPSAIDRHLCKDGRLDLEEVCRLDDIDVPKWFTMRQRDIRDNIRFCLPFPLELLEGMTPLKYIEKYIEVKRDFSRRYGKVFWKFCPVDSNVLTRESFKPAIFKAMIKLLTEHNYTLFEKLIGFDAPGIKLTLPQFVGICALIERFTYSSNLFIFNNDFPIIQQNSTLETVDFCRIDNMTEHLEIAKELRIILHTVSEFGKTVAMQ